ncbi:MAG: hypothetical protein COB37_10745 [Kordiimonadales bacterium]|nr:MAG: hypothetical protein COB37_10745 [Kordiimonadales bacterium]
MNNLAIKNSLPTLLNLIRLTGYSYVFLAYGAQWYAVLWHSLGEGAGQRLKEALFFALVIGVLLQALLWVLKWTWIRYRKAHSGKIDQFCLLGIWPIFRAVADIIAALNFSVMIFIFSVVD